MNRPLAAAGSAGFFLLAPGAVAGLGPWAFTRWRLPAAPQPLLWAPGAALLAVGLAGLVACFIRFAWHGRGTPAPIAPPTRLMVGGLYRYVRNPMYVALMAMLVGQAMIFASLAVLIYAAAIFLAFHVWTVTFEEPQMRGLFPEDYAAYSAAVPRWIPRLTPWRGPGEKP
jgi:protein-S-isoprenylcysteine O-methyltransferase Ste14